MQRQIVTVERFYKEHAATLQMRLLAGERGLKRIIREPTVNRPGLVLSGFTHYFAYKRVQVFGNAEVYYLRSLTSAERSKRYAHFFAFKIPCIVFSRGFRPDKEFLADAEKAGVPVFQCPTITMKFINAATLALETMFAPRGSEMGSMVDILGVGVLIRGESGIGKSEAVLALIERGYSLVSDDVTRVTLLDGREVVGTSAELTRDHMEIRGIGIINVAAMFGVKSIRNKKRLDLVVTLKVWNEVDGRGPRRHGTGIRENSGRGHSAHRHSRPPRTRSGAAHRSCRVSDQVENVRPQRGPGIERPPHRPHEPGQSAAGKIKFSGTSFPYRLV